MNTDRLQTLSEVETACWHEIARAAQQPAHAWRHMTLATVEGERAEARTVMLREALVRARQLLFYTDDRSPKMAQVRANPLGTLLVWSRPLGWQLRMRVRLETLQDGLAVSSRWARLKLTPSAQDYLSPSAPGTPLAQPGNERGARNYFTVVVAHVQGMDWLELHPEGHRRALFDPEGARWVQP